MLVISLIDANDLLEGHHSHIYRLHFYVQMKRFVWSMSSWYSRCRCGRCRCQSQAPPSPRHWSSLPPPRAWRGRGPRPPPCWGTPPPSTPPPSPVSSVWRGCKTRPQPGILLKQNENGTFRLRWVTKKCSIVSIASIHCFLEMSIACFASLDNQLEI